MPLVMNRIFKVMCPLSGPIFSRVICQGLYALSHEQDFQFYMTFVMTKIFNIICPYSWTEFSRYMPLFRTQIFKGQYKPRWPRYSRLYALSHEQDFPGYMPLIMITIFKVICPESWTSFSMLYAPNLEHEKRLCVYFLHVFKFGINFVL